VIYLLLFRARACARLSVLAWMPTAVVSSGWMFGLRAFWGFGASSGINLVDVLRTTRTTTWMRALDRG
jgi:hypothetical protein